MARDLTVDRQSAREQGRIRDLFALMPERGHTALDIGARDGYLSKLLAERFDTVVALDLERPPVVHPRVQSLQGDASQLPFDDGSFELVICAEVLEHIPSHMLDRVCREIGRVASGTVVIGVPYKQDIRLGRTTCRSCGKRNPPWGHVNSFDEARLLGLFGELTVSTLSYVGTTRERTSAAAAALMDFAGNPFGTYSQEERCVYCGSQLSRPTDRALAQRLATRAAVMLNALQRAITPERGNWIHAKFEKLSPSRTPIRRPSDTSDDLAGRRNSSNL